jgi:glycosyltransferase involved in cell wall biosynthesis
VIRLVIITEIIAPYRIPAFNALAERREVDLHVVFLSENDPTLRQWRIYKDEIKFFYQILPSWRYRSGQHFILLNWGMISQLNRINPNVVLSGGYNYLASWQAAYWAKKQRVPFILWSESTSFDRRQSYKPVELMKKHFLDYCSTFVVPGKSSSDYLLKLGVERNRVCTAPNSIDNELFSRAANAARQNELQTRTRHRLPSRYFLYVGRLVKEKGVFDLLQAYAQLEVELRRKVGLVFAGSGSDHRELESRALEISDGCIRFLDFVHREDLPEIYALAESLIFPTHSDPWGLVVNEAMACSLPIVCTGVAGCASDLVEHGWNGFIVETGDVSGLSREMTKLAENSALRMQMSARSRQRIEAYSPPAWAEGIVQAIRSLSPK